MFDIALNEIEILKNEIKDVRKVVQIGDEREHEYKEEIVTLKTLIEEARRLGGVMNNQLKTKRVQYGTLVAKIVSARSELD